MKNRTKAILITLITIAVLAAVAAGVWFFWLKDELALANASPVYVNPVSSILGQDTGANPRYTGIVEPQEIYKVRKDDTKTVSEVLVRVGDEVKVGDLLFRYDNQSMALDLTQAEIDLESIADQIATYQRQLTDLRSKLAKASNDDQYAYTVQINALEVQIRRQEFESDKKKAEVDKLRESLTKTEVYSDVEGVVKEINDGSSGMTSDAFISILSAGEYRVKGTVSELNVAALSVGQQVVVHSRIDSAALWTGTISSIDQEAAQEQENGYYYGFNNGERSSKYYFYVKIDAPDGLILGQHVYIEPYTGPVISREGIWLPAIYVAHDEEGSYVWARGDNDKLEKRLILLGDYDETEDLYEIKDGLARTDLIAFPTEELKIGLPTTTDPSSVLSPGDVTILDPGMVDLPGQDPVPGEGVPSLTDGLPALYAEDSEYAGEAGTESLGEEGAVW